MNTPLGNNPQQQSDSYDNVLLITISPPKRSILKPGKDPLYGIYMDDKFNIETVFKYDKIRNYILYPEIDDKGRLHYHGKLYLTNSQLIRYYKHAQFHLAKIGFVDVNNLSKKTQKDNERWTNYMQKDWKFTSQLLDIEDPLIGKCHVNSEDVVYKNKNI